jgi:hypothetical protein
MEARPRGRGPFFAKELRTAALTVVAAMVPAAASAQIVDFAQFDYSEDTRTFVLVKALADARPERPDPLLTASYTEWDTGSSTSVGYVYRWALTQGRHSWSVGAGVGLTHFNSRSAGDEDETGGSLRAQTEISGPAPGGSYFALLQLSTFREALFALAQYNVDKWRVGFDISRYEEETVKNTALGVRIALDERRRWFARVGVVDTDGDQQPFIGIAYNAF